MNFGPNTPEFSQVDELTLGRRTSDNPLSDNDESDDFASSPRESDFRSAIEKLKSEMNK